MSDTPPSFNSIRFTRRVELPGVIDLVDVREDLNLALPFLAGTLFLLPKNFSSKATSPSGSTYSVLASTDKHSTSREKSTLAHNGKRYPGHQVPSEGNEICVFKARVPHSIFLEDGGAVERSEYRNRGRDDQDSAE